METMEPLSSILLAQALHCPLYPGSCPLSLGFAYCQMLPSNVVSFMHCCIYPPAGSRPQISPLRLFLFEAPLRSFPPPWLPPELLNSFCRSAMCDCGGLIRAINHVSNNSRDLKNWGSSRNDGLHCRVLRLKSCISLLAVTITKLSVVS